MVITSKKRKRSGDAVEATGDSKKRKRSGDAVEATGDSKKRKRSGDVVEATGDSKKRKRSGDAVEATGDSKKRKRSGDAVEATGDSKKRKRSGDATENSKKRKRSGEATGDPLEATRIALKACRNTLRASGLPFYATHAHVEQFFGMLLDTFMVPVEEGLKTKDCFVRFKKESLALKALQEKNNQYLLGNIVCVNVSSVPLAHLRTKCTFDTIRQLPYDISNSSLTIKTDIRAEYQNMLNGDFIKNIYPLVCSDNRFLSCSYWYATIVFNDGKAAEVMRRYEEGLESNPIRMTNEINDIPEYIRTCQKQKFWF